TPETGKVHRSCNGPVRYRETGFKGPGRPNAASHDKLSYMPLAAGQKLGPYEILSLLGTGGMGEVYRARDPRLGRDVAIKISDARFSERFEREARAVAALNHPNICHLYDVGPDYIVMELVDGEMLSGPLALSLAVDYARQIADALEAAHEKGIV